MIAIIAILAAILFPVFARARENARRSSCQSNLKQIGLGVIQYQQDYDEKFPVLRGGNTGQQDNNVDGVWAIIQPYLKSTQIYQCPSETNPGTPTAASGGYSDYAYSVDLGFHFADAADPGYYNRGLSSAAVQQSSLTVMACDFSSGNSDSWTDGAGVNGLAIFPVNVATRHLDTQNFLFCDGHVKSLRGNNNTPAADQSQSAKVYGRTTPLATSLSSPTFNTQIN